MRKTTRNAHLLCVRQGWVTGNFQKPSEERTLCHVLKEKSEAQRTNGLTKPIHLVGGRSGIWTQAHLVPEFQSSSQYTLQIPELDEMKDMKVNKVWERQVFWGLGPA
jgi:hypothetical protein